ncbi:MAG: serine/threonine protein kinase [Deltaproteobacteria bacterium]|nr:MAG: serine/threonine protein kinase [Deltaproteobacteria bacterium]
MRTLTFNYLIGSGSMGSVYHAELRLPGGFRRPCAVKVIKAAGPDREHFVSRMRDEARLLGMLQDEQILGVTDLVLVDGHDAVIMEYVEGVDLQQLLKKHQMPPRALAELGAEIAGTLHRAHTAKHPATGEPLNVIHRDIKPANIMVTVRGGVRLLDFGVARAAFASRESHTQGLVLGTLNYFPPEILAGEGPTTAIDVYGLGLSLWECATGKEWGPPRVQQARFERRVDQRLGELSSEYGSVLPVLRQIMQWDPKLRPDGGVVERALLHAADSATGQGLRTWAREVVPGLLQQRPGGTSDDPLISRTIEVQSFQEGPTEPSPPVQSPPEGPAPLDRAPTIAPRAVPDPSTTFNADGQAPPVDLPPPAPRDRSRSGRKPRKPPASRKRARKRSGGMHWVVATLIGAMLGLLVLGVVAALLVLIVMLVVFLAG